MSRVLLSVIVVLSFGLCAGKAVYDCLTGAACNNARRGNVIHNGYNTQCCRGNDALSTYTSSAYGSGYGGHMVNVCKCSPGGSSYTINGRPMTAAEKQRFHQEFSRWNTNFRREMNNFEQGMNNFFSGLSRGYGW